MRVLAVDGGQSTIRVGYSDGRAWIELGGITHMEGDTASAMVRCSLASGAAPGAYAPLVHVWMTAA
jgi:hypothetical protein